MLLIFTRNLFLWPSQKQFGTGLTLIVIYFIFEIFRFNLYLKLFIVMGVNWVMELISVLAADKDPTYTWILTDLANTLQGVLIFIIFVCKRQIWLLLVKR